MSLERFLFLWLLAYTNASQWQSCVVDETIISAAKTNIRKLKYASPSVHKCVMDADDMEWVELFCYRSSRCIFWDLAAIQTGAVVADGEDTDQSCWRRKGCISPYGTEILDKSRETAALDCSSHTVTCDAHGQMKENVPVVKYRNRCDGGFSVTEVGCLLINIEMTTYSAAKASCLQYGAGLYYPDSAEQVNKLSEYLATSYPEISDFWAGIEKTYSEHWVWATGQRASKDDTADLENSDQSYARYTRGTGTDFKMEAISCDREIGVICRL